MREIASSLAAVPPLATALYPIEQPRSGRASSINATTTKPSSYAAPRSISATPRTGYTGRYTQADPIEFLGGDTNWYAYAGGNPVGFADPLGLERRNSAYPAPNMNPQDFNPGRVWRDFNDRRRRAQDQWRGQNAMRHCVFSCQMTPDYGPWLTRVAGVVNEVQGFLRWDIRMLGSRLRGQMPWAFDPEDLLNNEHGFACAERIRQNPECTDCERCCRESIFGSSSGAW